VVDESWFHDESLEVLYVVSPKYTLRRIHNQVHAKSLHPHANHARLYLVHKVVTSLYLRKPSLPLCRNNLVRLWFLWLWQTIPDFERNGTSRLAGRTLCVYTNWERAVFQWIGLYQEYYLLICQCCYHTCDDANWEKGDYFEQKVEFKKIGRGTS